VGAKIIKKLNETIKNHQTNNKAVSKKILPQKAQSFLATIAKKRFLEGKLTVLCFPFANFTV
jgi:hypothetical protein